MRPGDLVRLRPCHRHWIALRVTLSDIKKGLDVFKPGIHIFGGFWYGRDPLQKDGYGKVLPGTGKVVGRLRRNLAPGYCRRILKLDN